MLEKYFCILCHTVLLYCFSIEGRREARGTHSFRPASPGWLSLSESVQKHPRRHCNAKRVHAGLHVDSARCLNGISYPEKCPCPHSRLQRTTLLAFPPESPFLACASFSSLQHRKIACPPLRTALLACRRDCTRIIGVRKT